MSCLECQLVSRSFEWIQDIRSLTEVFLGQVVLSSASGVRVPMKAKNKDPRRIQRRPHRPARSASLWCLLAYLDRGKTCCDTRTRSDAARMQAFLSYSRSSFIRFTWVSVFMQSLLLLTRNIFVPLVAHTVQNTVEIVQIHIKVSPP